MSAKIRVLVVDDSVVIRRLVSDVIESDPELSVVGTAANGRLAIQKLEQLQPDVVTLDIEMPEMNGFEVAEAVRADPKLSALPIIALSSLVSPAAIERGRQAGFHDYVAKFDRPGLIAALKEQTTEIRRAA